MAEEGKKGAATRHFGAEKGHLAAENEKRRHQNVTGQRRKNAVRQPWEGQQGRDDPL